MREWALDRWVENTQVDLVQELPRIKAETRVERETKERMQREHGERDEAEQ